MTDGTKNTKAMPTRKRVRTSTPTFQQQIDTLTNYLQELSSRVDSNHAISESKFRLTSTQYDAMCANYRHTNKRITDHIERGEPE